MTKENAFVIRAAASHYWAKRIGNYNNDIYLIFKSKAGTVQTKDLVPSSWGKRRNGRGF